MLPARIEAFLNAGDQVAVEVAADTSATRCFVHISPRPKPGVPREARRYLNSGWSMWEYWDFDFCRLVLRDGWEQDEWNYDRYLVADEHRMSVDAESFNRVLVDWVPSPELFKHVTESECPYDAT